MKAGLQKTLAIGLKMKKMAQKMCFGSGMTMTTPGISQDFKEEEQEKDKVKVEKEKEEEDKDEDSSDLETKEKEKDREKARVTLQTMRATGLKMNGKEMKQRIGMMAIWPMKMKQHGIPKAGMNGKEISTMSMDTS